MITTQNNNRISSNKLAWSERARVIGEVLCSLELVVHQFSYFTVQLISQWVAMLFPRVVLYTECRNARPARLLRKVFIRKFSINQKPTNVVLHWLCWQAFTEYTYNTQHSLSAVECQVICNELVNQVYNIHTLKDWTLTYNGDICTQTNVYPNIMYSKVRLHHPYLT